MLSTHFKHWGWLLLALAWASGAHAEIYKKIDAQGRVTYSNSPTPGAVKVEIDSSPAVTAPLPSAPVAEDPRKAEETKKKQQLAEKRAQLEEQLAQERQALEDAKAAYAEGEKDPEVFRAKGKDGKTVVRRNVARYQEKIAQLQENVDLHQKKVELLEKEIAALK